MIWSETVSRLKNALNKYIASEWLGSCAQLWLPLRDGVLYDRDHQADPANLFLQSFHLARYFSRQVLEQKVGASWQHLLMAQSWEAAAVRREYLYCRTSWITLSAGTLEMGWNLIVESTRSCTWELRTRISAVSWELISWKWQKKRKIWVYLLISRWLRTPNRKQLWQKACINRDISRRRGKC